MPLRFAHAGDFHLDEDRYFSDTAQCLEWFVADAIRASVDFFVINGDLTTYKATIKERNFWVDRLDEMANHAPVILVAGNHGAELEGDLYVFGRANGPDHSLSREQQDVLWEKLLAANPAKLKVKIEHDADLASEPAPIAAAHSAEEKLRAYWTMKGTPPVDRQARLLAKLAEVEKIVLST